MLRSLLVGVSDSPEGRAAVKLAIQWARPNKAKVCGIGVLDDELLAPTESVPLGASAFKAERDSAVLIAAERELEKALREFEQSCAVAEVPCKVFEARGQIASLLTQHAQRADVVMLGRKRIDSTWGAGPTTHTAEQVLKQAVRPVICVPARAASGDHVLIGYDGSLPAARTLAAFVGLGVCADLPIRIVAVENSLGDLAYHASLAEEFLEGHGFDGEVTCFTTDESPSEALLRLIAETHPALVVLGAYGKNWLREMILGSVTKELSRKSDVPLFLYQ